MEKTTKRVSPQPEELLENLKEGAKSKEKVSKKEKNNKFVVSSSKTKTQPKKSSNKKTHKSKTSTSKSKEKENKSTTGRKWNEKSENLIKGKITPEEGKKIAEALCEYAFEKQLSTEELLNLITEKQTKKENKVWTKIAECLPGRSVQSIHNYCHRTFHPYNYKGFWTKKEEEDLLTLVKEHGKKWELIGKELQRTATNVKDKYKQLGGDHHSTVSLDSTLGSKLKLLKEIEAYVNEKEEDKKYKIFNYPYVFNPTIDEKFNVLFRYDESKEIFKIDSSIKDERSKCIIRNIFKHLINLSAISKIIENKLEISWTVISNNIKTLSFDDCKNEWAKIIKDFGLDEMITKKRDYKMIKQIASLGIESKEEITWEVIRNKRSIQENKVRLEELLRSSDIYNVKSFSDNIKTLNEELEKELYPSKESESEDYKEEISKRREKNISVIYADFLERKRGRPEK